ncbi:membrane protein (plasmid) [Fulvitalea axinellae]|uniref:Membrane protein n=1 Tax=Fulvitalea axinellae TaxID=1182444 RepID=A0AAU9CX48_9BACT|nr:membrane protein [Fulvitalea axinellae]
MKKIKILFFVALSFSFFGCSDWLQLELQNSISKETFWKSEADVEAAVNSTFIALRSQVKTMFWWGELRGDFLQVGENAGGDVKRILALQIVDDNGLSNWTGMYTVINLANSVLKNAPATREYDASFLEEDMNAYMAEAYFVRSLVYFYLVRTFHEVPLVLEPSENDDVDFFLGKSSEETILNQIIEDLVWAEQYAKRDFGSLSLNKGRGSQSAIQALLADVYLWAEKYDECLVMCDKIISRSAHALMTPDETKDFSEQAFYDDIFDEGGNSLEGVFEIQYSEVKSQPNPFFDFLIKEPEVLISDTGFEAFEDINDEERGMGVSFDEETLEITKMYLGGSSTNWIVYRYADILLMKAEALVQQGASLKAQKLLNKVRERAGLGGKIVPGDKATAEDMILSERALEFAFEGKRWFDLLRVAKRNNFERKQMLIDKLVENAPAADRDLWESKLSDPMSYFMPIYYKELRNNINLKQNPYYEH